MSEFQTDMLKNDSLVDDQF
jgi:hypothetical protein